MIRLSTKTQSSEEVLHIADEKRNIVLFNDEVNTFDFVIECLMEVCNHDPCQAEQCALITHFRGKCPVMSGSYNRLEGPCTELQKRGLSAEIA